LNLTELVDKADILNDWSSLVRLVSDPSKGHSIK